MKYVALLLTAIVLPIFTYLTPIAHAEGTYDDLGTTDSADGSADAINFSQGRVWTVDQYGKYIWLTQTRSSTVTHWAWSNNNGTSWSQGSESYSFLTRASVAYDSNNDKLHVIWAATDSNDGIIYRRYGITRDGSNNITAIAREDSSNVNLQLDTTASRTLSQPVALWVDDGSTNGILVAIWTKYGTSLNEVRGSMRKLSLSSADGVAGNWVPLDGSADTFGTDAPAVSADKIYGDTSGDNAASALVRGGSGSYKDDLYVFVHESDGGTTDTVLAYRAAWSSGSTDWSGGWQSPITMDTTNLASGYNLKEQLITKPVLDTTNDRLYISWAKWADNTLGDTVSLGYLDSTNTASTPVNVYSANGTHSYAPTMDIAYDSTLGLLYVSYIQSTTNGDNGSIDYKSYDGSSLSSATRFYTTPGGSAGANGSADIPILYESRSNNRLLFAFRVNGALPPTAGDPHTIYWGYSTLSTPTPTPTPTSAAVATRALSSASAPSCTATKPESFPLLSIKNTTATTTTITFSYAKSSFDRYIIEYGNRKDVYQYAFDIPNNTAKEYTIKSLAPNTTYYVRIRAGNGCNASDWSSVVTTKTASFSNIATTKETDDSEDTKSLPEKESTMPNKTLPTQTPTPSPSPIPTVPLDTPPQDTNANASGIWSFPRRFFDGLLKLLGMK